jgi:hypothetical protein
MKNVSCQGHKISEDRGTVKERAPKEKSVQSSSEGYIFIAGTSLIARKLQSLMRQHNAHHGTLRPTGS